MKRKANNKDYLDVQHYLGAAGKLVTFPKKRAIFTQGDSGNSVFYLKDEPPNNSVSGANLRDDLPRLRWALLCRHPGAVGQLHRGAIAHGGDKAKALYRFMSAMCRYPRAVVLSTNGQARYFMLVSRYVRKKDDMSIKVLLADDSHVMLAAIRKRLAEDSRIRLVGAVSSFAAMMQMISDFKPEVLLLDLRLPEERHFTPDFIKSQLGSVPHTLAVSLSNDADAKALAASYGAESLLDKMKLYDQMIPAIMSCCNAQEIRYPGRKHPNQC